ncbi:MAG: Smr/MutS family protein [Spirochaetaceae bacterium]|jgi:DNA mismatch repair protein MutS2|nr:Smr/MutS family protein [Spirochaetaceae bacterium]
MNDKTLALLEFDSVRNAVSLCALSEEAGRKINESLPLCDSNAAASLKRLVSAVLGRLNSGDAEPLGAIPAVAPLLPVLGVEGTVLGVEELYALGIFAERGEALREWLRGGGAGAENQNTLREATDSMPDCRAVSAEVFRVLDRDGKLRDLPEFREIKRRIQGLTAELEKTVARYIGNDESRRMLRSAVPSQRDGRTVLAVKANFRGRIKGIVHEVSGTGQTLFVEPEDVVEKNNSIIIEQRRLDAEIRRVLRETTASLSSFREDLALFHERVVYLETLRARARYSRDCRGHFAKDAGELVLAKARHPLLGSRAVPVDFAMSSAGVIITGPNTGGKTVALKTIGLFALMNQFGLALPSDEGTSLPVFDGVYADIGDEQSLAQSLSTFSAHIAAIASITARATSRSLVLLDELGSGTDPLEGGAIAMAVLDYLVERGSRVVVTTHHGALKNYGYTRSGVENASVEFDGQTLSPTYRIVMGIPGESRAVDIASRNGLPAGIVAGARSYLEDERADVSALIAELKKKHRDLDAAQKQAAETERRLREEKRSADLRELRLRQKELELKQGGMGKFRLLLQESRKKLENLVREVKEGELSREKTLKVKEFLRELGNAVGAEASILDAEEKLFREDRGRVGAGKGGASEGPEIPEPADGASIVPGSAVLVGERRRRGKVIRAEKGGWLVETGSLRITVDKEDLISAPPVSEEPRPLIETAELSGNARACFELNLRGMRLEEALETLQRQIDAAVLSGLGEFSVIHGKGDGILQKGVHEYLANQGQVADYYFSRPELGGFGRTEVVLMR